MSIKYDIILGKLRETDSSSTSDKYDSTYSTVNSNSGSWSSVSTSGVYRNMWLPAGVFTPRVTNGAEFGSIEYPSNYITLDYYDFSSTIEQAIQTTLSMPDEWDRNPVRFIHKWTNGENGGIGSVDWGVKARNIKNASAIDGTWETQVLVVNVFTNDGEMIMSNVSSDVTLGTSLSANDIIVLEISRVVDTLDTYDKKARYLGCFMQYKESSNIVTKWTVPS